MREERKYVYTSTEHYLIKKKKKEEDGKLVSSIFMKKNRARKLKKKCRAKIVNLYFFRDLYVRLNFVKY